MGAWAQDPVPGAAAGAALSPGMLFWVPGKMLDIGFRILYHILEYYILILYI